jgi:hypothetical protein
MTHQQEKMMNLVEKHLAKFVEKNPNQGINIPNAMEVFADAYIEDMTEGCLISDSCLLSSIGYSRWENQIEAFLTKRIGFSKEQVELLYPVSDFRRAIFKFRNKEDWKTLAFSRCNYDFDRYEKALKNPEFVKNNKEAQAKINELLEAC